MRKFFFQFPILKGSGILIAEMFCVLNKEFYSYSEPFFFSNMYRGREGNKLYIYCGIISIAIVILGGYH